MDEAPQGVLHARAPRNRESQAGGDEFHGLRMPWMQGELPDAGPCSTICPSCMTAISSAIRAARARSCEIRMQVRPKPATEIEEEFRQLRLQEQVETGERLVEDEQRRLENQRAGDGEPLPFAAAECHGRFRRGSRGRPTISIHSRALARRASGDPRF